MWLNRQETTDLVTFAEKIFNGKLHFLCNDDYIKDYMTDFSILVDPVNLTHRVKSVFIQSYSSHFLAFGLNTERYSISRKCGPG